jgi:hypothetical protein
MSDIKVIIKDHGVEYAFDGWYGCVLKSIERRDVREGDTRIIRNFPFYAYRIAKGRFGKRAISWLLVTPGRDIHHRDIEAFKRQNKIYSEHYNMEGSYK